MLRAPMSGWCCTGSPQHRPCSQRCLPGPAGRRRRGVPGKPRRWAGAACRGARTSDEHPVCGEGIRAERGRQHRRDVILNSLLDSLHQIVFINIGETSELFLRVSEALTHNNTGARGDPTQLCLASVTNFSQLNKGAHRNLGGISFPHSAQIPSHPTTKL